MTNKEMEKQITNSMKKLEITRDEAIDLIKFDLEEVGNEEAEAIEAKIKEKKDALKAMKPSPIAKVKMMKAKKKIDAEKQALVDALFAFVKESDLTFNVQEMTGTKVTMQGETGEIYSIALTKHRGEVNGYKSN